MNWFNIYIIFIVCTLGFTSCDIFGGEKKKDLPAGEVIWKVENEEINTVSTQPLIDNGVVYFIQDGMLKAYTLKEGERLWQRTLVNQGTGDYAQKHIQADNIIFVDLGFRILAINKSDGKKAWETQITNVADEVSGIGKPILSQDESFLYAGRDGYVVKLRKQDGEIVHRYELDRLVPEGVTQGATEPIISPFGDNILYVPTSYWDDRVQGEEHPGANLFAFDASTGEVIWERRMEYTIEHPDPEADEDSLTISPFIFDISVTQNSIVALAGKVLAVVNRADGSMQWFRYFEEDGGDVGLAVKDGAIYFASGGGYASKFDLVSSELLWRVDIKFSNTSIPIITNGRMYFNNSGGGGIWVLDISDGSVIYHENTPNYFKDNFDVYISSLGVGEGFMVNVGSKYVYCLTVP